jgi:hypothetical protein
MGTRLQTNQRRNQIITASSNAEAENGGDRPPPGSSLRLQRTVDEARSTWE